MAKKRWLENGNEETRTEYYAEYPIYAKHSGPDCRLEIGTPKPNEKHSVDELIKMGVYGIYAIGGPLNKEVKAEDIVVKETKEGTDA